MLAAASTRYLDACRDAYWDACWRDVPLARRSRLAAAGAALVLLAVAGFLGAMLRQPFYLGNDSAQSYAHVWYIAQSLFGGDGVLLRMPNLEAGRALTFPYALVPWLPAALAYPLSGDWVVTASMVVGALLIILGLWRWLPRTQSPLITAILLLNPQFLGGIAQFQLPSFWAIGLACLAAAEFVRARSVRGTALAAAALYAHPLVGAFALFATLLVNIEGDRHIPWAQVRGLVAATILATPAIWMTLHVPLLTDGGVTAVAWPMLLTLKRISIIGWAWALDRWLPVAVRAWPLLAGLALLASANDLRHVPPVGLWEASEPRFADLLAARPIEPAATYRVLVTTNHEDGMVELLRAGATLGHEFFDESIQRQSFGWAETYRCFLASKRVDRVIVSAEYPRLLGWSDEPGLLEALVRRGEATRTFAGATGTREYALTAPPPTSCPARVR